MFEVTRFSAKRIAELIRKREVSAEEVIKAHLERIDKVNPFINAVVQKVDPEKALEQARQADEAVAKKQPLGLLHGVPITIKDAFKVKDFTTSCGCKGLVRNSDSDATVVSRLRKQGAIILGLTNVSELTMCPETDNLLYGRTNNPYNLAYSPGGSSGGEGAIIAAGGSPLGLGTDGGGSIRLPAHCCGITGLKPSHGLLPHTGNLLGDYPGIFHRVVTYGPMARYVEDLILTLPILAGPDGHDYNTVPIPLKDPAAVDLKSLKLVYHFSNGVSTPTDETVKGIQEAVNSLKERVNGVVEGCPAILERTYKLLWETIFLGGDQAEGILAWLKAINVDEPSPLLKTFIEISKNTSLTVAEIRKRFVEWDFFHGEMLNFMADYDVLLCPVQATPARKHGVGYANPEELTFSMSYSLIGWPAAVVRCGTSSEGLPIGIQIVAKPWNDHLVLAVAQEIEKNLGGWQPPNIAN